VDDVQEILTAIRRRLDSSVYPQVRLVHCTLRGGHVVLTGRVTSFFMKQCAQEAIRNGAVIDNEIEVVSESLQQW
jgi:hypothetical protein